MKNLLMLGVFVLVGLCSHVYAEETLSCDVSQVIASCTVNRGIKMCIDFIGSAWTLDKVQHDCKGEVTNIPCPTADVVGSCKNGIESLETIQRIYSPFPAAQVPMVCKAGRGTQC